MTLRAGTALVQADEAALAALEASLAVAPPGAERLLMRVDGAMVPLVGGEFREARTLVIAELAASPEPAQSGKTTGQSYFSRLADAETFTQQATLEVHRRGPEHATVVAAVADGALWCQSFFDLHAPQAVRILDFPHAVQHLHQAAEAVFGAESGAARGWIREQATQLKQGAAAAVLNALVALPVATAADPDGARLTRDQVWTYLDRRRAQLDYATFATQGLPIGSGAVESANKLVVEARLKGAGMHWAPTSVNPMLSLRSALCSDRWVDAWTTLVRQWREQPQPRALPAAPTVRDLLPGAKPPPLPPVAVRPPQRDRPKLVVNGKPTPDHPWKRPFLRRQRAALAPITQM